jgi:hypothetical protein
VRLQSQFLHSGFNERFIYSIPLIGLPSLVKENRWPERGNTVYRLFTEHMNVEIGTEAAQFLFGEYHKFKFLSSVGNCHM